MVRGAEKSLSVPFCLRPTFLMMFGKVLKFGLSKGFVNFDWAFFLLTQIFVNPLVFFICSVMRYPAIDI